jgi:succinyl-CoA synthetase beta subunit
LVTPSWSRPRSRWAAGGKAGGIQLANSADEVRTHAGNILGMDIKGHTVHRIWIERSSDIAKEYYASFTLDRPVRSTSACSRPKVAWTSKTFAASNPDAISMISIDPVKGLDLATATAWVADANLDEVAREQAAALLVKLYECYSAGDCDLAEINPLILTTDNKVHALDAKVTLDENAAFRHPEWEEFRATETEDPREKMAKEKGLN